MVRLGVDGGLALPHKSSRHLPSLNIIHSSRNTGASAMSTPTDTEDASTAPSSSRPVFTITCKYASMFDNDEAAQFKVDVTLSAPKATLSDKGTLEKARTRFAALLETCRDHLMAGFQYKDVLPDPRAYKDQWPSLCKSVVQDAIDNNAPLRALNPRCEVQLTDWKEDDGKLKIV